MDRDHDYRELTDRLRLVAIGLVWLIVPTVQAQNCARQETVKTNHPASYQARGNRCEGTYDQPVAHRLNLRFAGFHQGAPVFDLQQDETVQITVQAHEARREVVLRVTSTRSQYYYQMDTSAIGDDGSFTWPLDVVRSLDEPLQPFDTAALACLDCDSVTATLLPVSFSEPGTEGGDLTVLAIADIELRSLKATLRQEGHVIFEDRALGGSYLPAHKPIRIPIDGAEAGVARLSLTAVTPNQEQAFLQASLRIPERGD